MGILRKVIGLGIAGLIVLALLAGGLWAFLSDTETSTTNQVTAGTLDLKTNDANGVTQSLYSTGLKPGGTVGPATVTLKNSGSVNAATVDISFSYAESDGTPNPGTNKTSDEVAAILEVTTLNYDGASQLPQINDGNSNSYIDLQDLQNDALTGLTGLNASATKDFQIGLTMKSGISNDFRGDGVSITMTFLLNQ